MVYNRKLFPHPPREARCEGTNLDVRGVLLHAWWLGRKIFALSPRPPRKERCEGNNLDMRGVLLHAWCLERKIFYIYLFIYMYVCIYIYRYISMDSGHSKMPYASSGTGMLLTEPFLGTVLKQIDLVSLFFPLCASRKLFTLFKHWSQYSRTWVLRQPFLPSKSGRKYQVVA